MVLNNTQLIALEDYTPPLTCCIVSVYIVLPAKATIATKSISRSSGRVYKSLVYLCPEATEGPRCLALCVAFIVCGIMLKGLCRATAFLILIGAFANTMVQHSRLTNPNEEELVLLALLFVVLVAVTVSCKMPYD
jgi:hypothetical protein